MSPLPRSWTIALSSFVILALILGAAAVPLSSSVSSHSGTDAGASSVSSSSAPSLTLAQISSSPRDAVAYPVEWPAASSADGSYSGPVFALIEFTPNSGLAASLAAVENPSSPAYQQFLNPSEFGAEYGVPAATYSSIAGYLSEFRGVNVTTFPDHIGIEVSGPAAAVGAALGVGFESWVAPSGDEFYAPLGAPHLPSVLTRLVHGVYGLDDFASATFDLGVGAPIAGALPTNSGGYPTPVPLNGAQLLWGSDLQTAYDELPLLGIANATGERVATVLAAGTNTLDQPVGPYVPSDVTNYYNATIPAGEPHATVIGMPVDGASPPGLNAAYDTTGDNEENTLDLEMVGSTAPGATIYNVYGPSSTLSTLLDAFVEAVNLNVSVISNSWEAGDINESAWTPYFEEAARDGTTVLASSGDSGDNPSSSKWSYDNYNPQGVGFPADVGSDTFGVLAVGGTTISLTPGLTRDLETAWNISSEDLAGGGPAGSVGGVSTAFPEPAWQSSTSASSVIGATGSSGRGVPDLAAIANNTLLSITESGVFNPLVPVWGTSIASPLVAGLIAEADAVLSHDHGVPSRFGFLDPAIYAIGNAEASSPLVPSPFFDVTVGGNFRFSAQPGYDLVSGWGVPNAYNLTLWLENTTTVTVTFEETGLPSNAVWTVDLSGAVIGASVAAETSSIRFIVPEGSVNYSVGAITGYSVSPSSGTLAVNGTALRVNITFAQNTTVGEYPLAFFESGLPTGTQWELTLNGTTLSSSSPSISAVVANGTYAFEAGPIAGWQVLPRFGNVTVEGLEATQTILYFPLSPWEYSVWFNETGLPNGTAWALKILGTVQTSTQPSILLFLSNGSYPFVDGVESGNDYASPASGTLEVSGQDLTVSIAFTSTPLAVTFTETGLPEGSEWGGLLDGGVSTSTSFSNVLTFYVANGTHPYQIGAIGDTWYAPNPAVGTVTVNGTNVNVDVAFTSIFGQQPVTFSEVGLPSATVWGVAVDGTQTSFSDSFSQTLLELNGSYSYVISPVDGYVAHPASGAFDLVGEAVSRTIEFSPISTENLTASFGETGLPNGTAWIVQFNGRVGTSAGSAIDFTAPGGSYAYGVAASAPGWTAEPAGGTIDLDANVTIAIEFSPVRTAYAAYFTESGLPSGSAWSLEFNGTVYNSSAATLVVGGLFPGSYAYSAVALGGSYRADPANGTVQVTGASVSLGISFSPVTYAVEFRESGLPTGTPWAVELGGVLLGTNGSTIDFQAAPGDYSFLVAYLSGYRGSPSSGTVTVSNATIIVSISFSVGSEPAVLPHSVPAAPATGERWLARS